METIIKTCNLSYSYERQKVVDNLYLEVPQHAIFGFLGPNGAGKTTTIKLLLGLLPSPENGIQIFDKELKSNRREILSKMGSLIEAPSIYRHLTAWENLAYLDKLYKKGTSRIEEVLKIIGLWEQRHKKAKHLSTGMKQRLSIGMAIFHDPELIVLDEPVNGLDPAGIFEVRELLIKLQNEGKTIFLSSHLLSEIEKLCTHVGIIKKGSLLFQGEIKTLTSKAKRKVEISTDDNARAFAILRSHAFPMLRNERDGLEVEIVDQDRFSEMISLLAADRIKLYDVEKKSATLEEVFIHLTSNE